MTSVKLFNEATGELRRIGISTLELTLNELHALVHSTFPTYTDMEYVLSYIDDEQDHVSLTTCNDVQEAFRVMKKTNMTLKVTIVLKQKEERQRQENSIETPIERDMKLGWDQVAEYLVLEKSTLPWKIEFLKALRDEKSSKALRQVILQKKVRDKNIW